MTRVVGKPEFNEPHPCTHEDCLLPGSWVYDRKKETWRPAIPDDAKQRKCYGHGPGLVRPDIKRRKKRPEPNERIQVSAAILLAEAREVTTALEQIRDELSMLGFPSSGGEGERVSGGTLASQAESHAIRISDLTGKREDIRDAISDVERAVLHLRKMRTKLTGKPNAEGELLCRDRQKGREGVIDWGVPTCLEIGGHQGLCSRCYQRERVWRKDHGLPFRGEAAA